MKLLQQQHRQHCRRDLCGSSEDTSTTARATVTLIPPRSNEKDPRLTSVIIPAQSAENSNTPNNINSDFSSKCLTLPSLDYNQSQYGQTWSGAIPTSQTITAPSQTQTLPTPPTTEGSTHQPQGQRLPTSANLAAVAIQQPMMGSAFDALNHPQSLTARRPAANHLPSFELPPPQLAQFSNLNSQRYPSLSTLNANQSGSNVSVGNLLTPPTNLPGETLSPISSGNSGNTGTSSMPQNYWASSSTPYSFGTGSTPQAWAPALNSIFPSKGVFSPSMNSLMRNPHSPSANDSLPPPPYDLNQLPPFPTSMAMSAPSNIQTSSVSQPQLMTNNIMSTHSPMSAGTQASPVTSADAYAQRPASTPVMYGSQSSSTSQQNSYPSYPGPSPVQHSPLGANSHQSRFSPSGMPSPNGLNTMQGYARPYPGYGLPALSGPIMSNMHSPGGQMSLVGNMQGGMMPGFNSGHAANMQMYGGHGPAPNPQAERPFKCDQCPQSFNRNHDLKRHKRIHLAVKPFPCNHCDKSFSRKDALKVSQYQRNAAVTSAVLINFTETCPCQRVREREGRSRRKGRGRARQKRIDERERGQPHHSDAVTQLTSRCSLCFLFRHDIYHQSSIHPLFHLRQSATGVGWLSR